MNNTKKTKCILPVLYFILQYYSAVNSLKFEGSTCKNSGTFGICQLLKNCPAGIDSMKRTATHQLERCGFVGLDELVCCPSVYKNPLQLGEHNVQTTIHNIVIHSPVKTNIPISRQTYLAGSDIQVPCEVMGSPKPNVQWYKDGVAVNPSERIKVSDFNTLIILKASKYDSGYYYCEATNYYSSSSSKIDILIEGINCADKNFSCFYIPKGRLCEHTFYKHCCPSCTEINLKTDKPYSSYSYKSYPSINPFYSR